jgi:hypothetical protein
MTLKRFFASLYVLFNIATGFRITDVQQNARSHLHVDSQILSHHTFEFHLANIALGVTERPAARITLVELVLSRI